MAVANLAVNHPANVSRLGAEACRGLVAALTYFIDRPHGHGVVLHSLRGLCSLCKPGTGHPDVLVEAGACQQACQAVARHMGDRTIASYGAKLLEHLAGTEGGHAAQLLVEAAALFLVADLLRHHVEDHDASLQACRTIAALAAWYKSAAVKAAVANGVVELSARLHGALRQWRSDRIVVMGVMEAVAVLGRHSKDVQQALVAPTPSPPDLPTLLVECMAAEPDDAPLQAKCLRAMASLACRNATVQFRLLASGAAPPMARALSRFPLDHDLQLHGLRAAATLADHCRRGQEELLASGLAPYAVRALEAHRASADVAAKALQLIEALARDYPAALDALLSSGLAAALSAAFASCKDRACQLECCRLVLLLCLSGPERLAAVGQEAGCVDGVVRALRALPSDSELQIVACEAIFNLSLGPPTEAHRQLCRSRDVLQGLLSGLRHHVTNEDLLPFAVGALVNLASHSPTVRDRLSQLSAWEAVMPVLHTHHADAALTCCACRAVSTFCHDHDGNRGGFVAAGVVPLLVRALSSFPTHADVQICAWEAVARLYAGETTVPMPSSSEDLPGLLQQTLARFGGKDRLVTLEALEAASALCASQARELVAAGVKAAIIKVVRDLSQQGTPMAQPDRGQRRQQPHTAEVVARALRFLTKLESEGSGCDPNTTVAVLQCLKRFGHDAEAAVLQPCLELLVAQMRLAAAEADGMSGEEQGSRSGVEAMMTELAPVLCRALEGHMEAVGPALDAMALLLRQCTGTAQDVLGERGACEAVARVLQQEPLPAVDVVRRALEVLGLLAVENEDNRERLVEAGTGSALIRVLQTPVALTEVRVDLIRAAVELAREDEGYQRDLGQAGIVATVLQLLQDSTDGQQPKLALLACWAVVVLSEEATNRLSLMRQGAIAHVVAALACFAEVEGVQTAGLEALRAVGFIEVRAEEQDAVLASLHSLPDNPVHQTVGLKLLAQLADLSRARPEASAPLSPEALSATISALAAFPQHPAVQRAGVAAMAASLRTLITNGNEEEAMELLTDPAVSLGRLLSAAVACSESDSTLACHVASILANVAATGRGASALQGWLRDEGCVELAIQLFSRWGADCPPMRPMLYAFISNAAASDPTSQDVLGEHCSSLLVGDRESWHADRPNTLLRCRAIMALAVGSCKDQDRLGDAGACGMLVEQVLQHEEATDRVKAKALEAASHLCYHHATNQERLVSAGVLPALASVMEAHADSAQLQLQAIGLLRNLMWEAPGDVLQALCEHGLADALCAAIERHGNDNAHVQLYGLAAMAALASSSADGRAQLIKAGAAQLIMPTFAGTWDALKATQALKAAGAMATQSSDAQTRLLSEGLAEYLHTVLAKLVQQSSLPKEAVELSATAVYAVMELARGNKYAQTILGDAGLCEDVVELLRACRAYRPVQRYGWDALYCLVRSHAANKARTREAGVSDVIRAIFAEPKPVMDLQRLGKIGVYLDPTLGGVIQDDESQQSPRMPASDGGMLLGASEVVGA